MLIKLSRILPKIQRVSVSRRDNSAAACGVIRNRLMWLSWTSVQSAQKISAGQFHPALVLCRGLAYLAVASADGVVRLVLLRIDDLLALAHSRITRSLTTVECRKYQPTDGCLAP